LSSSPVGQHTFASAGNQAIFVQVVEAYATTQNQKTQTTLIGVAQFVQAVLEMQKSTPVSRAEYLMRFGDHLFWCRECSGEPPEHIRNYEHYGEATCGECFFRFRR
jgi:Zn finger protein HypA/HybF involved in hydrogenase expression